ncbi:hypothetical protein FB45DRAFT_880898 [Roridomyces roridus]|uniref:Uncharacterized protein n=1 Tax=Roridomyces roridus TaxID=1738132 RepID=A0AAD7F841_9AGAR|nr:hypothetical protein FB45DRAFT_880898 [Roridomyces roridus]
MSRRRIAGLPTTSSNKLQSPTTRHPSHYHGRTLPNHPSVQLAASRAETPLSRTRQSPPASISAALMTCRQLQFRTGAALGPGQILHSLTFNWLAFQSPDGCGFLPSFPPPFTLVVPTQRFSHCQQVHPFPDLSGPALIIYLYLGCQPALTPQNPPTHLDNNFGISPCEFTEFCSSPASQPSLEAQTECLCTSLLFFTDNACNLCSGNPLVTWTSYAKTVNCGLDGNASPDPNMPSPLPGRFSISALRTESSPVVLAAAEAAFPSWAMAMVFATPLPETFDAQAATSLALFITNAKLGPPSTTSGASALSTATEASSPLASATRPPTSQTSVSHVEGFPTRAIGGIAVGIIFTCSLVALGLVLRYRRRRRQGRIDPFEQVVGKNATEAPEYTVVHPHFTTPFGDSKGHGEEIQQRNNARLEYLQNELRAAQEKISNIPTRTSLARMGAGADRRSDSELLRLREQNVIQVARIRELEAQMTSPWALGLSDEPPPGYEERGTTEVI